MPDQTTKKSNKSSSKPRITKLFRHRSHKIQFTDSLTTATLSNATIHTSIGLSSRIGTTSNQTESIISLNSIETSKNQRCSMNGNRPTVSVISRSQSKQSRVRSYSGKNDLKEPEDNDELKKDRIISASEMTHYQNITHDTIPIDNRSDLRHSAKRLSSQMNFPKESREELNKNNRKKRKAAGKCWKCSRLCIFFSILAAVLIATAIAAALISILNKTNTTTTTKLTTATTVTTVTSTTTTTVSTTTTTVSTTTVSTTTTTESTTTTTVSTTTTTETTTSHTTTTTTRTTTSDTTATSTTELITVTYVPTGIWALEIPTCATWNQTGVTVAGNSNGAAGNDLASLNATVSIFVDNNYTLYVCDRENHRILMYPVNVTVGTIVAGDGTPGNSPTQLYEPKGVAVDQMGAVIVADSSNYRIQRFPPGSLVGTTVAFNSSVNLLGQTRDLHIDVNNGIYVTDSDYSRIVKFYPNNGLGIILAGSSGPGSAADQLDEPYGNFMDGNQTLFVADFGNHRVQMWPTGATTGTTVAGITSSSGTNLLKLKNPRAVVTDNNGYVYIADSGNNRIVRWTTNYAAGGTCIVGCGGSGGVGPTQLKSPRDLKFDASGNLYVSDQGNNRVQMFAIQIPPNCTASG